jgi:hypothetical protein
MTTEIVIRATPDHYSNIRFQEAMRRLASLGLQPQQRVVRPAVSEPTGLALAAARHRMRMAAESSGGGI